jgi:DNA-directed RNA polymerase specialized sigma24 family protein
VQQARSADAQARGAAWNVLCAAYWRPAVVYLRALGCAEAEDVAQEFWQAFTRRDGFGRVSPEAGTLRSYLKQSLRYFYRTWLERRGRQKRGGGRVIQCLDDAHEQELPHAEAELRYLLALLAGDGRCAAP